MPFKEKNYEARRSHFSTLAGQFERKQLLKTREIDDVVERIVSVQAAFNHKSKDLQSMYSSLVMLKNISLLQPVHPDANRIPIGVDKITP